LSDGQGSGGMAIVAGIHADCTPANSSFLTPGKQFQIGSEDKQAILEQLIMRRVLIG